MISPKHLKRTIIMRTITTLVVINNNNMNIESGRPAVSSSEAIVKMEIAVDLSILSPQYNI